MKAIFLLGLMAVTAQAQSVELPNYLKDKLDENTAASAFQLTVNNTLEKISGEKNYRESVENKVTKDLNGWGETLQVTEMAASSLGIVGGLGSMATEMSSENKFEKSSTRTFLASSGVGFVGAAGLELVIHKDVVSNVLNDTKADEYAASTASRLAKFFLLPKAKEMALKFAIKEEIYRKNKANDLTPIDIVAVVKNAKHSGQPILTEKESQAFERVHAELLKTQGVKDAKNSKPKTPELSLEDKIGYLIGANAMLEVQHDMDWKNHTGSTIEMHKAKAQIDENKKLIREIQEYRKTEKMGSAKDGNNDDEKQPGAVDAE